MRISDGSSDVCSSDLDDLRALAADGRIDNVVVAVPGLPGRLQGSRVAVDHFLDRVLVDGFGACTYLLASDVEMQTRTDYAFSPWDRSEEHTSELQSLMRISYAVCCLKNKKRRK